MTQGGLAAISELTELEKERKMEKGYIRYDYDPEHENKEVGELKNILDTTTDCAYLTVKG